MMCDARRRSDGRGLSVSKVSKVHRSTQWPARCVYANVACVGVHIHTPTEMTAVAACRRHTADDDDDDDGGGCRRCRR